ncbi:MAG: TAXI family TRAP transporter solute-binding subunit [Dehalococcoidales bacterium]|nr:TAXI family TRAP transporter solute-binding subunit [Dehalococcoidales bacterium]
MRIKRTASLAVLIMILSAVLLTNCRGQEQTASSEDRPQNITLTILGFMTGTTFQMRSDAIAEAIRLEYPDWTVNSIAPGGESQLVSQRIAGEGEFFLTPYVRQLELEAQAPLHPDIDYDKVTAYNLVVPTAPQYIHFVALGKTGLTSIREIVEQKYPFKIGVGPGGSRMQLEKILEYYGASLEEAETWGAKTEFVIITSPNGVEALQSGIIDTGISWSGLPCPAFMGVTFNLDILPIDDTGLVDYLKSIGYYEVTIPVETYSFLTEDVPTVASVSHLAVRPELSEDIVYYVVKAIFNQKDFLIAAQADFAGQLTPEAVVNSIEISQTTGIFFHPGALKFFRENGWID